jgi:hypothetical protein
MLLAALLLSLPAAASGTSEHHAAAGFFVSPRGSDSYDGSAAAPFRTIGRAAAAVRALPRPLTQTITVHIAAGDYPLTETLQLNGAADSGSSPDARVEYVAEGGRVRLLGGQVVSHTTVTGTSQQRLPRSARVIDLKAAGITDFGVLTARGGCCNRPGSSGCPSSGPLRLTFNSGPMHIARWPNLTPVAEAGNSTRLTWTTTEFAADDDPGVTNTSFCFEAAAPFADWQDWSDVWAHGLWWYLLSSGKSVWLFSRFVCNHLKTRLCNHLS